MVTKERLGKVLKIKIKEMRIEGNQIIYNKCYKINLYEAEHKIREHFKG